VQGDVGFSLSVLAPLGIRINLSGDICGLRFKIFLITSIEIVKARSAELRFISSNLTDKYDRNRNFIFEPSSYKL